MSSDKFAIAVAVAMFAAGLLGLLLQRVLPEHHTTGGSRDMIGAIAGLLTLLCALVAGLLIWTAYGVYSGQNAADSGCGVEGHATRPCALRLRSGSHAHARRASGMRWERPSINFGMFARATTISPRTTSPRRLRTCALGIRRWRSFIPRPTTKSRRSPPRTQRPTRSVKRECRCPSRSPRPSPIRFC